jgi:RNA polymerase sigma-70 factor (ECF subfamily)
MDDREVERVRTGDAEALDRLMTEVYTTVYTYALQFWRDVDRAQDATQEICYRVLRALPKYRPEGRFRTWVLRIAFNYLRHQWRYERLRRWWPLARAEGAEDARELDPETRWETDATLTWLMEGLRQLSPAERSALILRAFHGLPYEDIAAALGCSLQQVKNYLFRGRQKLRRRWMEAHPHENPVPSLSGRLDGSSG